jgi:cytochrome c biogenesis factor
MEYATLIAIIALSLTLMASYVMRSVNARVAHVWADLYHPQVGVR